MAAAKRMTKAQVISDIAQYSELDKKSVGKVFEGLTDLIKKQLGPRGPGEQNTCQEGRAAHVGASRSVVDAMYVVHHDAIAVIRQVQPVAAAEAALRVAIAALPMLAHRGGTEIVILGLSLVGRLLIDQ